MQKMQEPLILGASSVKTSLSNGRDKLGSIACALKKKAATSVHTAEAAWKHGIQAVETAMELGVSTASGGLVDLRNLRLHDPLFGPRPPNRNVESVADESVGPSKKAETTAPSTEGNDIRLAAAKLNTPSRKRIPTQTKSIRRDNSNARPRSEAETLVQLSLLEEDFELQLALAKSRHTQALKELDDLMCAQVHESGTVAYPQAGSPPASHFLPSVGTWLRPLPRRFQSSMPRQDAPCACSGSNKVDQPKQSERMALSVEKLMSESKAECETLLKRYTLALDAVCNSHCNTQTDSAVADMLVAVRRDRKGRSRHKADASVA